MNLDYDVVLSFASKKHEGQYRDDGVTPYIEHPVLVAEIIRQYKQSKNIDVLVAAALLHDTLEDTNTSYTELKQNFGEMVASIVMEVTSAKISQNVMTKGRYLKHKMKYMTPYALCIKLADRLANLNDVESCTEYKQSKMIEDTYEIISFLEEERELTVAQKNLIEAIKNRLNELNCQINNI